MSRSSPSGLVTIVWGLVTVITIIGLASAAQAHHFMDGSTPTTFGDGLLSGLAHPVIGPDHLAFILAIGLLSVPLGLKGRLIVPAVFIMATILGAYIGISGQSFFGHETIILAGLMLAAVNLWRQSHHRNLGPNSLAWIGCLALALIGLAHGYAYAEAIIGADKAVAGAYLTGFAITQWALAFGTASAISILVKPAVLPLWQQAMAVILLVESLLIAV